MDNIETFEPLYISKYSKLPRSVITDYNEV